MMSANSNVSLTAFCKRSTRVFGTQSILIAASNHQYLFDPALWRRFDEVIEFSMPEIIEREKYLKYLLNGAHFEGSLKETARRMASLSYSDIQRVVSEGDQNKCS